MNLRNYIHTYLVTQEHEKPCTHVPVMAVNKTPSDEGLYADEHRNTGNKVYMCISTRIHKNKRNKVLRKHTHLCTYEHKKVRSYAHSYVCV